MPTLSTVNSRLTNGKEGMRIDGPEKGQAFGNNPKHAASALVLDHKMVKAGWCCARG
jgi:hypothetical protein